MTGLTYICMLTSFIAHKSCSQELTNNIIYYCMIATGDLHGKLDDLFVIFHKASSNLQANTKCCFRGH